MERPADGYRGRLRGLLPAGSGAVPGTGNGQGLGCRLGGAPLLQSGSGKEKELTLADVLGDDWISICNAEIDRQIREQIAADPGLSYFGYGDNDLAELKFRTVDGETDFYLNAAGEAVVVFPEYAIAPGYMGYREFVIGKQG